MKLFCILMVMASRMVSKKLMKILLHKRLLHIRHYYCTKVMYTKCMFVYLGLCLCVFGFSIVFLYQVFSWNLWKQGES